MKRLWVILITLSSCGYSINPKQKKEQIYFSNREYILFDDQCVYVNRKTLFKIYNDSIVFIMQHDKSFIYQHSIVLTKTVYISEHNTRYYAQKHTIIELKGNTMYVWSSVDKTGLKHIFSEMKRI